MSLWQPHEVSLIETLWAAGQSGGTIAKRIGKSRSAVFGKLYRMRVTGAYPRAYSGGVRPIGSKNVNRRAARTEPDDFAWIMAAYKFAREENIPARFVLNSYTARATPEIHRARWKAWKLVLDTFPHVSMAGLGRVSGFDHSTISRAVEIMRAEEFVRPGSYSPTTGVR